MDRSLILLNILLYFIFVLIIFCDLRKKIIPDFFTLGIILLGGIKIIFFDGDFEKSFIGMGVYPLFFIFLYGYISDLIKLEIIGFGDIKLLLAIGFYFGYLGIYNFILLHNIIFILAFIYVLPKIILKKIKRNKEIPFAPFICIGSIIFQIMVIL